MTTPFFTIITATYNAEKMLPQLLNSLASQTCKDFEIVVQDGASKDSTAAIIEQYRDKIPHISFASENDTGIYDAWNKALKRIQGEWVLFLGADDKLAENTTFEQVKQLLKHTAPHISFAAGSMKMFNDSGRCKWYSSPVMDVDKVRMEHTMPAAFPSLFQRRRLFTDKEFNPNYRIAADYDWLCRVLKDTEAMNLDVLVTIMLEGGVSTQPRNRLRGELECARIASNYFPHIWTKERIIKLMKAIIVSTCFTVLSFDRAATFLDFMRKLRGLPPVWFR